MYLVLRRSLLLPFVAILGTLLLLLGLALHFTTRQPRPEQSKTPPPPSANTYGEFLPWSEVNRIFPKYDRAVVIDYETGLQFKVQRRAGSTHADVQPLSAADTKIMKTIYGRWSWKRRAVLVVLKNGRKIAASMNGMPHGAGAIQNNNFNGHFCIHFRDSRVHSSGKCDLAHQLMVWKAAGRFDLQVQSLPPVEVIKVFFTLLNQGDQKLAGRLVQSTPGNPWVPPGDKIQNIQVTRVTELGANLYQVDVRISKQGSSPAVRKKARLAMLPGPPCWRITAASLNGLW